jgi:DNA-binding MarR family transcriptional regulator
MNLTLPATFVERIHELSPGATTAYVALAWLKLTGTQYPTQPQIAAHMNATSRSVVTYLKELEQAGYLRKRRLGNGRRTDYILLAEVTYGKA